MLASFGAYQVAGIKEARSRVVNECLRFRRLETISAQISNVLAYSTSPPPKRNNLGKSLFDVQSPIVGYNNLVAANQGGDFVQAPPFIAMHCDRYSSPSVIGGLVLKDGVVGLNGPELVPVILQHIPIGITFS